MYLLARALTYSDETRMRTIAAQLSIARIPYKQQTNAGRAEILVSARNHKRALAAIGAIVEQR